MHRGPRKAAQAKAKKARCLSLTISFLQLLFVFVRRGRSVEHSLYHFVASARDLSVFVLFLWCWLFVHDR